ncbi:MAG: isopenicillin N synthase family oxygenase [Alphaproteobacteria bacterium]|nr:MAG: isopenicillin N synthase family oxygenase [Alphaproteobacteria bacterium]
MTASTGSPDPRAAAEREARLARLGDRLRARRIALDAVPVVDFAGWSGDAAARDGVARAIDHALTNIGFMYLSGHGVPERLRADAFRVAREFFARPQDEKMALHISRSGPALHGYTEFFGENADPGRTRDYKEIFDLGREAKDGRVRPFFGPTPWPTHPPDFREVMTAWHDAMLDLALRLMRAIARALGLPEDRFDPWLTEPIGIQRMLHYPPQEAAEDESLIGIGAHTDYGLLTILAQDEVGGLQVMNRDGDWIEAPPIPGTFVINIGDIMQRLTNDRYLANLHRVVNISGRDRYSLPFFFDFDYETVVAPLPECCGPDNPPRYEPIVSGEHKWRRYLASFPHLREQGDG